MPVKSLSNSSFRNIPYVNHAITLQSPLPNHPPTVISALMHPSMIPLLPDPLPFATLQDLDPPYKIILTKGKGFAMYASRPISQGSLIIIEHPVFIVPAMPLPNSAFEVYEEVGQRLPIKQYEEMVTMANCRNLEECPSIVEGIARTNAVNLQFLFPAPDEPSSQRQKGDTPTTFEGGRHYGGAFLKINRSNHSCGPNAAYTWNLSLLSASLYALRDIAEGEEITITYADPLQRRSERWKKLEPDYGFTCDCPWCTHQDPVAQRTSDSAREYLGTYVATHPAYRKWSIDFCLPDTFVIDSHLAALPLIYQEGLEALLPLFLEEIMWCYAELGEQDEFQKWAAKMIQLCSIPNVSLARELENLVEDPVHRFARWGLRKKIRLQEKRSKRSQPGYEIEDMLISDILSPPPSEGVP